MGLPKISIEFRTLAGTAIQRSEKGVVGIILRDSAEDTGGVHILTKRAQIPEKLGAGNYNYTARAFLGYITPPRRVLLYVIPNEATSLKTALEYMESELIDYIVGPPDLDSDDKAEIISWVKEQRMAKRTPKAVLPHAPADDPGIINFTSEGIITENATYTAAEYCSRIAGLIAGTPMTISCTYAPLPEVSAVNTLSKDEMDAAIDAGEFIIFSDRRKVKVGRGVNSFVTTIEGKGDDFKKIKIVETLDMINNDIRTTAQDSYIGKYANSYDNKCLLISAIDGYYSGLESVGILAPGKSRVDIDLEANELYLSERGTDTESLNEKDIREANTGSGVFLSSSLSVLDAIEDIKMAISI